MKPLLPGYTRPHMRLFRPEARDADRQQRGQPFYCPVDKRPTSTPISSRCWSPTPVPVAPIRGRVCGVYEWAITAEPAVSAAGAQGAAAGVRTELQADRYAGVWAYYAREHRCAYLEPLSDRDIQDALSRPRSGAGDDHPTADDRTHQPLRPDAWLGQRQKWFTVGYQTGSVTPTSATPFSAATRGRRITRTSRALHAAVFRYHHHSGHLQQFPQWNSGLTCSTPLVDDRPLLGLAKAWRYRPRLTAKIGVQGNHVLR